MLSKLFCKHKWTVLSKSTIHTEFGWTKTVYILVCGQCGKIKKVTVR